MEDVLAIAGYCRISVDEEQDRENTSIENQKAIIADYIKHKFPKSKLDFYEDRDRSGYTFEQREGYQRVRPLLMSLKYDVLVVKDFSRFSRRNSRGLVELEDLRDAGVRIIAIDDSIDYPTYDDWMAIQFRFLVNEMPVTDASKKVKSVIKRRQNEGKWICSVPYGYTITNSKAMTFEVDEAAAAVIRKVFELYNEGWGYKKIANHLTERHIPTPRMSELAKKEAAGEEYKRTVRPEWSIVTVSGILGNDFYIGTLRQGKYKRKKINGSDMKLNETDHIVFEGHHEPIIDYHTFAVTQEQMKKRTTTNYRGIKKYDNVYSGFLVCGDCDSPMFGMSRPDLSPAYTCGTYHKRGRKGCTSHHTRVDVLDNLLKAYIGTVRENSAAMLDKLEESLQNEQQAVKENTTTLEILQKQIDSKRAEIKMLLRQQAKELIRNPDDESVISRTYNDLLEELTDEIEGLQNQLELTANRRNTIIRVNRITKTALNIFDDVLTKDKLDKNDLELVIENIIVYEDHVDINLKTDIDALLKTGELPEEAVNFKQGTKDSSIYRIIQSSTNRRDKVLSVHVISSGDPLEIYTDKDGEVIFKKYSPMGELSSFATQMSETLSKTTGSSVAICDRDVVIALSGAPRKELVDKRVGEELEKLMEARQMYQYKPGEHKIPVVDGQERHYVGIAAPILAEGDISGCVIFMQGEGTGGTTETEYKLAQTVAAFLGKQMET